jgi:hypothetical protein
MFKLMKFRRRKSTVTQNNPANPKGDRQSGTTTKDEMAASTAPLGSSHTDDVVVISCPEPLWNSKDRRKKEKERKQRRDKQHQEDVTRVETVKPPTNSDTDTETDTESDTETETDHRTSRLALLSRTVSTLGEVCKVMASSATSLHNEAGDGAVFSLPPSNSQRGSHYSFGNLSSDDNIEAVPDMDCVKLTIKLQERHWEIWDAKES